MAYATTSDVRSWLGIYDASDDDELNLAIAAAEAAVRVWCGYDFGLATNPSTKVFAATNGKLLDLSAAGYTIGSLNGLAVATDEDDDGTFEVNWAATDWQTEPLNNTGPGTLTWPVTHIRAIGDYWFPHGGIQRARVQVTARWGWATVPTNVKLATIMLAAAWHQRRATVTGRSGFDGYFNSAITDDAAVQDLLRAYRAGVAITGFG